MKKSILSRLMSGLTAVLASVCVVQAQQPDLSFINLNASNSALSFNKVHVITQDAKGFIWMGTADGLNRYDGRNFKTFGVDELGTESAFVVSLCADDYGNLWVGTDSGMTWYNYEMDSFMPLTIVSDKGTVASNKVSKISLDKDGTVWFSVLHQGLFSYDGKNLINYFYENGEVTLPSGIRAFFKDNNGVFWFSLYFDDLYWSDDNLCSLNRAEIGPDGHFFTGDDIMSICRNPVSNTLFIASNNRGLCEVDVRARSAKVLIPNDDGYIVESMNCDRNQHVWLSTTKGLYRYDIAESKVSHYTFDSGNPYGVSENHIFDAFTDNSGGLWVATYSKGVDYSGNSHLWFDKHYTTHDGFSLSGALMRSMTIDEAGNVWMASEEKGLYVYSRTDETLRRYVSKALPDNLFGIFHDAGKLWIGSFQGIISLEIATGRTKLYSRSDDSADFKDSKIYTIFKTSDSGLYFGTTLGLFKYDRQKDSFHAVKEFEGVFVVDIIEDRKGELWMASYADGVFRYVPATGEVVNYRKRSTERSIPCDKIMSLFEDSSGRIWAASFGGGFFTMSQSDDGGGNFNHTTLEGLPGNVFYKILEDNEGCLWLSSSKGLVAFNPDSGRLRSFTESDGLLDDEFNYNSACKLHDGRMIFGSTNGFVVFNPASMAVPTESPDIVITDFTVNSRNVRPGGKDSYLKRHVNETDKIVLAPGDNSFGLSVSLLGSGLAAGNTVECILEGYDKDWRKSTSDMMFSWENVPAGRYTLCVKGQEGGKHKPIEIVVRQKFYKSPVAVVLYILLLILSAVVFVWCFLKRAERNAQKVRKEYEHAKEEELFRDKLSFFASVIHEIKTPLTLIKTPLQNIIATGGVNHGVKDDLAVISRSADYLDQLVKELLDFIRLEKHGYVLEYRTVDLVEKLNFLCFNFSDTAKSRNLRLSFVHDDQLLINADETGITKILNNLIHNAVKYAESYIDIKASRVGDNVEVRFVNDGPAIPESRRDEIFKPFVRFGNSKDSYTQSFGIGLSLARNLAELHNGNLDIEDSELTCFVLTLPLESESHQEQSSADVMPEIFGNDETHPLLMIVEDNADLLEYIRQKLCDEYRIITSQSAEKALGLLKKYSVDVLVTDISLPGMSGVDLCEKVTSDFATSHVPVIILSAISNTDTKLLCVQKGASMYIEKPFSMDYLRACVRSESRKTFESRRNQFTGNEIDAEEIVVPGSDKEFLESLDRVIYENLADPQLSNEQIATALFISKTTLIRKMKGLLGTTPNDYVRLKRLNLASRMLLKEGCRISDVCYSVGFNTPSYFTKCFKREFGVLPAEYIKQHKNNNQQN